MLKYWQTQPRPNSSRHKHGQHRYRTFCGMSSLLQHGFAATARPVSSSKPESHENTTRTTNLAKCGSEAIPRNMSIRRTLRLFFFKTSWRSRPPWAGTLSQISSLESTKPVAATPTASKLGMHRHYWRQRCSKWHFCMAILLDLHWSQPHGAFQLSMALHDLHYASSHGISRP
jgi:hypothetical protein